MLALNIPEKNDFGHLLNVIKDCYKVDIDWTGGLYCRLTLDWNCKDQCINK